MAVRGGYWGGVEPDIKAILPSVQAVFEPKEEEVSEQELQRTFPKQKKWQFCRVFNALESRTNLDGYSIFSIFA